MRYATCVVLWFVLSSMSSASLAQPTSATGWDGKVVVMANGELLGRVEDLAVDLERKAIVYVVVSVGSFLIDENLIAVDPDALRLSDDGFYFVLHTDTLDTANRFGADDWPDSPDVLPAEYAERVEQTAEAGAPINNPRINVTEPVATISDGRRTGTIRAGEKSATIESEQGAQAPARSGQVQPKRWRGERPLLASSEFEKLDEDGDGYLTRREIGGRMREGLLFSDFDYDGNDGIDPFEFEVMIQR
ncbi:MAG: PRC-barrel domain-containing protein [Pseudomonadota bacterium]